MIRSLIVDDEPRAVRALEITLERHCPEIELVGIANNIEEAFQLIVAQNPDLIFLDINMPKGTGLDLLERIKDTESAKVIFTTAHEEYAIKAFRLSAIDYLLKPVGKEELIIAINRFKETSTGKERMELLSELLEKKNPQRMAISTLDGFHIIDLDKLLYLSSEKNYSNFHTTEGIVLASKSIGEFEKYMDPDRFIRVHRSYIVNIDKVRSYDKKKGVLILHNQQTIEVSRNRKEVLLQKLKVL
ncbi:LytR/AlgR family response regulator transcription factor [Ekhidna sp.]|uniref:LytR/AlgR family response regulator transcription factor n=1 Tax=Ekhidna sp. TaxID=2608089 RepID=UPI003B51425B